MINLQSKDLNFASNAFRNKNIDFIFGPVKKHWLLYMATNHGKFILVGDFIQVIQQVFY